MHPEFPLSSDLIYLNHAAVAPWPLRTAQAVTRFAEENVRYGAARYPDWVRRESILREQLRDLLNAPSSDDIALVKNTSEAISLVAFGLEWREGDNIVSSSEEFPSNRIPWQALSSRGVAFREANLAAGSTPEDALFELVDARTRLITISSVQYASGLRLDLEKIGRFCRDQGILFCIDAIQSLGALRFDVQRYHADFVMADGHKWMLGPEGLAVFYTSPRARNALKLMQYGWHMVENAGDYDTRSWIPARNARRFECGSPNMLGIHALSASLSLILETGMETIETSLLERTTYLAEAIMNQPLLQLLSPGDPERRSGIITFRHRSKENQRLFQHLKQNGVICALRGGGIRFSPHFYTPLSSLERAIDIALGA
ncbi:aminotransferase class V-fold PLP-dependent enzyme [Methylocaldum szegediense]|uniref:Selenocysteine lyase/cysteine desulfurase n=1 Tax=Methylocaldum szegediense TaxID=73780 RepID=A0ABN8X984_9GAMM|nr:aminotransferase class V-fold PLP-dependent enzyme [Methylocaldum szegediense]CAI8954222.1 Selenocysteine lyase/cysteine desulfurase [Methylocaldum szegediense]